MKNATKHADELKALVKKLSKETEVPPLVKYEPIVALVRGLLSYDVPDAKVEVAMAAIDKEFVDLNELRVATELEVEGLLGSRYPHVHSRVARTITALNFVFEKEHVMNFERIKSLSKKDARQFFREFPDPHPFVDAYVVLHAFEVPAVPVDDSMVALLKSKGIIEASATLDEAQRFVESHTKPEEMYTTYYVLRTAAAEFEPGEAKAVKKAKK